MAQDAVRVAGGTGIVLAGSLVDRALRFGTTWVLSGTLGVAGYGAYAFAVTIASVVSTFSPLGLDSGLVLFGARYRKSGEHGRLKGALWFGAAVSAVSGGLAALGLWALAMYGGLWADEPETGRAVAWIAPVVALWTPLSFCIGALRGAKDMRSSTLAQQIAVPGATLVLGVAGALWTGTAGALLGFVLAHVVGLAVGGRFVLRRYRAVLADRSLQPVVEAKPLLAFSIPQSLAAAAFRLNLWMDILMLGWLATIEDVGVYKVAVSVVLIGNLPVSACMAMFNPFVAELVYAGDMKRLNGLLKVITRWLLVLSMPVFLVLVLVPDLVLSVFDEGYGRAATVVAVLTLGRAITVACAPTMRLIPMSGRAALNLANGVVALVLNVVLNAILIPRMGLMGAAVASAITLSLWSLWRVVEVWWLLKCFPFSMRSAVLLAFAATSGGAAWWFLGDAGVQTRVVAAVAIVLGFALVVAVAGRSPADAALLGRVRQRLAKLLGRATGSTEVSGR